jgi:hypothetical protein
MGGSNPPPGKKINKKRLASLMVERWAVNLQTEVRFLCETPFILLFFSFKLSPQKVNMVDDSKLSELFEKHLTSSKSQYHQQTNFDAVKDTLD